MKAIQDNHTCRVGCWGWEGRVVGAAAPQPSGPAWPSLGRSSRSLPVLSDHHPHGPHLWCFHLEGKRKLAQTAVSSVMRTFQKPTHAQPRAASIPSIFMLHSYEPPISTAFSPYPFLQSGYFACRPFHTVLVGEQDPILTNGFLPDYRKKPTKRTSFRLLVHV